METMEEGCLGGPDPSPTLAYVRTAPGIELGSHAFLRPLPPCCAAIASPYWGRVIGAVSNTGTEDVLIHITATMLDNEGRALGSHADFMALDKGDRSEFDIRITTFYDHVHSYGLEVTEASDL